MKVNKILIVFTILVLCFSTQVMAVTITADVSGDIDSIGTPIEVEVFSLTGNPVSGESKSFYNRIYGDFTVSLGTDAYSGASSAATHSSYVGDGENDETWWAFDFRNDSNYSIFNSSANAITSAILSMVLSPTAQFSGGDGFYIPGLNGSYSVNNSDKIGDVGDYIEVQLELIGTGGHSAEQILNKYLGSGTFGPNGIINDLGILPSVYFDDALVVSAEISLTKGESAPVPEPTTIILFGIGLLGLAGINRRKN